MEIFKLFGSVFLKDDGVNARLDAIDRRARGVGSSFGTLGGVLAKAGAAAGAAVGALGVGAIKGASDLEGYRNTLNVVMKDQKAAAETMAWAIKYANETPFETDSVVQATVKLQSYGLTAKEVLPTIGDMASVMNRDLVDAVEAVADAQTGELERLKEFSITKQQIIDQGNKIMRGHEIVNNKGQIVDQQAFNKALFSLMNERFKGGTEMQAKSFKGLMSTLKGSFQTTLATMAGISATGEVKIGGPFDRLKGFIQRLNDKIAELQKNGTLERWGNNVTDAIGKVFDAADKLWKKVGPIIKDIKSWIENDAIPAATQFKDNFVKAFNDSKVSGDSFKQLTQDLKDLLKQLWDIAQNFSPESGTLVGQFFGILAKNLETATKWAHNAYKALKPVLDIIEAISNFGKNKKNYVLPPTDNVAMSGNIGAAAEGVDNWRGGPIIVGEKGPELLNLPPGSQVIPNNKIKARGNTYITVNARTADIDEKALMRIQRRAEMLAMI